MSEIGLPQEWASTTLEQVSQKITDGTHKTPTYVDKGVRFISIKNIKPYKPVDWVSYEKYISPAEHRELVKRCHPEKGDILFPRIGTLGYAKRIDFDEEVSIFVGLGLIKPNRQIIDDRYLEHYMNSPRIRELSFEKATGAGRLTLALQESKLLPCLVPPLAEQKVIADKLDILLAQVESIKARLERITEILKQFRQSVLAAAMSGKLMGNAELAWQEVGSFASDIRYGTSKKCDSESGETPVLRIPNIGWGHINLNDLKYADFDQKELDSLKLKKGDLLLIRSNGSVDLVGKVAIVSENEEHCIFAGYLIRLRLDAYIVDPKYVAYCLQSPQLRQVIELIARSTSGVNNINSKELLGLKIPVPSLDVQQEIIKKIEQLQGFSIAIEQQVQSALDRVNNLTQSILAKAFRGELTAEWRKANSELISDENSAEALLERIKAERTSVKSATKRGRAKT